MMRPLGLDDAAAVLGRSGDWLRHNWKLWVKTYRLPRPIHEHGTLVWDAAQLYAWLDRDRPQRELAYCAAFRAAFAVASQHPAITDEVEQWRQRLARRRLARVAGNDEVAP